MTLYHNPTSAETITVVAPDYWCPYSCKSGQGLDGYSVDILRAIFESHGHQIVYSNQNYSRALREVKQGQFQVIPAVYPSEAPDFIFSTQAVSNARFCFYTQVASKWRYAGTDSLHNQTIGIVQNYSYGKQLDQAIAEKIGNFRIHTGDAITKRMITEILSNRFDSFVEDEYLVAYELGKNKEFTIRNAGCESPNPTYIAFSPALASSKNYANVFDKGIKTLRASGKLQTILNKYGLQDWEGRQ